MAACLETRTKRGMPMRWRHPLGRLPRSTIPGPARSSAHSAGLRSNNCQSTFFSAPAAGLAYVTSDGSLSCISEPVAVAASSFPHSENRSPFRRDVLASSNI